ncbi:MAG: thiamine pyrophosphate-dependent enzyme [Candidatus Latescibacterota bacterium]
MSMGLQTAASSQQERNRALLVGVRYLGERVESDVLPVHVDIASVEKLDADTVLALRALELEAEETVLCTLASLARIGEGDHLGGALELVPSFLLTLTVTDYERVHYTVEHAHTSAGYFASLAALGFLERQDVVEQFRRSLDIPGHVSWVPGGTEMNGGRLGVMIPTAVGNALGRRARLGRGAWVLCHCGDAGYISGQGLNGFNGASVHHAPVTFVMHRNGVQLSGATKSIMDRDPRAVVEAMGIQIIEVQSLLDVEALYAAYRQGYALAQEGRANLIYPVGWRSTPEQRVDLAFFGERFGVRAELETFAAAHKVPMDREVWIPGSLMSYRDLQAMFETLFLVNDLPGGKGHHDGHLKGRSADQVLSNPMFRRSPEQRRALEALRARPRRRILTRARPAPGSANLVVPREALAAVELPGPGKAESPRAGSQKAYELVARHFPEDVFVVSCDLDPSTKLDKAVRVIGRGHHFEMSIEEQAAALLADGLATCSRRPQLTVVSTFAAFFEGIAREGFDMWRYQRNLTGANEGLNVVFHISHVGAITGRDHFSGWGLDWINVGLTYLPYLHRFYAPCDARAAFLAVVDLAAHYGGHIIGIPRDELPVLDKQDGSGPLWAPDAQWEAVTSYRQHDGARRAILACGAPAYLAGQAASVLGDRGMPADVHIVNGLPLPEGALAELLGRYPEGVVTVEDGLIGSPQEGVRGLAGVVALAAREQGVAADHLGITDPRIAPSHGYVETWEHFGITADHLVQAVENL